MVTPGKTWTRLSTAAVSLSLLWLTLALYWPVTHHEFVSYDDVYFVTGNPQVEAGLTAEGFKWAWHSVVARNWHPLTMLSHMLDCQLFQLDAGRHHLVSLLFHATNAVLLFLVLQSMTGAMWRSALVAALFAWHPLHVESVAWIAERKDVLSAFFFMLTLMAYAGYVREIEAGRQKEKSSFRKLSTSVYYGLALVCFALGLMSKPMLVTVPFVLWLLDFWPLRRLQFTVPGARAMPRRPGRKESPAGELPESKCSISRLAWEKAPFLAMGAAVSFVTWRLQSEGGAVWSQLPFTARFGNAAVSYIRYLENMVWPEGLAAFYPLGEPWSWPYVMGALLLLGLATFAAALNWQRRPWLVTGWLWYLGMLVPVIGLVQVGMQEMADRYTYLPLIGVFIGLVWGAGEFVASVRVPGPMAAFVAAAALLGCMVVTRLQLGYWNNSETLYRRMLAVTKNNYAAEYDLGDACYAQGRLDEAGRHYAEAVRLAPGWPNARNNLGNVLLRQRHYDEAISQFREAVRLQPGFLVELNLAKALAVAGRPDEACPEFEKALQLEPDSAEAQRAYGQTLATLQRTDLAVEHYQAALKLQPDLENAEFELGNLLANHGHVEAGIAHYQAALRLNPNLAEAYDGLGFCFSLQRKWDDAAQNFARALELKPTLWPAMKNLALVDMARHQWEAAIPLLRKSLELKPGDALVHVRLGQCLEQTGKPAEAENQFQQALQLDPGNAAAQAGLAALRGK